LEKRVDESILKSKSFSKNPKTRAVGNLYRGGALGAKGWYHISRKQWVRAYFSGKKGNALLKKVIELEPEIYDAYLGVGMYQYYAATLGPALKVLASFFVRGNKAEAMRNLKVAAIKSRYVKTEASYFLWNAAADERRLEDAHKQVAILLDSFPRSPLFKWSEIQTFFYERNWKEVLSKSQEFIERARAQTGKGKRHKGYSLLLSKVLYHCGAAAFNLQDYSQAKSYFDRTIEQAAEFKGWKTMAYLRRGELYDADGKRTDALRNYRHVFHFPDVWKSHKTARKRIDKAMVRSQLYDGSVIYSPLEFWQLELK